VKSLKWLAEPEAHDYEAATNYLSLLVTPEQAKLIADALRQTEVSQFKAKDILRASGLPALPADNRHVNKDLKKISNGESLSPILLVRGDAAAAVSLIIADGYHRVCAIEEYAEDLLIHCKIVGLG